MTAQILTSELSNLIQESKRKNTELRNAAEKSLDDLKSLRVTSEAQIAADLTLRSNFVAPFLIACSTKNAKFTGIAIVCLQRLVVSRALPRSRLKEVVEALRESTSQGLDVQLKILQALPSLLQNYADELRGDLLAGALSICSILQASKNGIVNNTAAATLQQLVVSVFDKVVDEDKRALEVPTIGEAPSEGGPVQLRAAALDAYRVFNDLCLMTESHRPQFLRFTAIPQTFGLELIESILTNHADIFLSHPEQANILRTRVMPFLINSLSEKLSFAATVRIIRILYILLRRHLAILVPEGEMALGLLTHMLDPDAAALWKRALCLEVFRGVFAEAALVRKIFILYDSDNVRKPILRDLVASFVKLSTEKPALIGLGHQSTIPASSSISSGSHDQAMLEASGVPGIVGSAISSSETAGTGISTKWSSVRVPCIDQLDKTDAPAVPETYIYSLTLTCINSFSEGLAKFILPLTMPSDSKSRKKTAKSGPPESDFLIGGPSKNSERQASFKKSPVPINPLTLTEHPMFEDIKVCAAIVDECWPAILATCSTFLIAALDAEYYHNLVRAFQKFTHVSGLLRLSTPRDAFLTTLGKSAVPPSVITASATAPGPTTPGADGQSLFNNAKGLLSVDSLVNQASGSDRRNSIGDSSAATLNTRNLLCLRALLNLGIALGPTLDKAWVIILETLQQADFVLFSATRTGSTKSTSASISKSESSTGSEGPALLANFGSEIKAVETAASRLLESTVDFPNEPFLDVMTAICKLFGRGAATNEEPISPTTETPMASPGLRKTSLPHRRAQSISASPMSQNQEDHFALAKLGEIASININRLTSYEPEVSGWDILVSELISTACSPDTSSPVRLRAAEILVRIVIEAAATTMSLDAEDRGVVQWRLLHALRFAVQPLQKQDRDASVAVHTADIEIHKIILEGLRNVLDQCGELLVSGWDIAFEIIGTVFLAPELSEHDEDQTPIEKRRIATKSAKLVRSSFSSLQLICSDFLSSLPSSCFLVLVDTLYHFSTQDDDLNICLTTITFFWVLSDFISGRSTSFSLDGDIMQNSDEQSLIKRASDDDQTIGNAALWMLLLLRLTTVTSDSRLELRNSAIQTMFRIFDAYGDQLSPKAWSLCLRTIIFKLLGSVKGQLQNAHSGANEMTDKNRLEWRDTNIVVLNGIANLFADYINVLTADSSFAESWKTLLSQIEALQSLKILDINTAVFKALQHILAQGNIQDAPTNFGHDSLALAWGLWSKDIPVARNSETSASASNQECLLAYVSASQEMYRLIEQDLNVQQVQRMLSLLRDTIKYASAATYAADIEYLTPLQTKVLDSVKMIRTDVKGVPSAIILRVAELVALAFQRDSSKPVASGQPTYVALSKSSMTLLETLIVSHASDTDIYTSGAVSASLMALARPITLKYGFSVTVKGLAPWRQATTTSLAIVSSTLHMITESEIPEVHSQSIWDAIVVIANGITAADCSVATDNTPINIDQDFDIESFLTLRELITPALGAESIQDKTCRTYTESLFRRSLIHLPDSEDLPKTNQELFACLQTPRKGRTVDPIASPRTKMSYICLDELISLVTVSNSSVSRIRLAQAAAPYLILRAGLTLKSYIADQPLRGRMPQPLSQRKELLYILKALVELKCEPKAIPGLQGVQGEGKSHLHRLYTLLARAVRAAARDQEVLEWLGRALDEVGMEFGN